MRSSLSCTLLRICEIRKSPGGKDNFAADREAGDRALEAYPQMVMAVRANRAFLIRAVRFLAGEGGIRQFLDIGTGIPTASNTHEVAQSVAPDSRIAYVDNDPVVLLHARALLTSTPEGACAYIDADFRNPGKILGEAAKLLDFAKPTALMLLGILQLIPDEDDPYGAVATLLAALSPGSYLVISHPAGDIDNRAVVAAAVLDTMSAEKRTMRTQAEVGRFLAWPGTLGTRHRAGIAMATGVGCRGRNPERPLGWRGPQALAEQRQPTSSGVTLTLVFISPPA